MEKNFRNELNPEQEADIKEKLWEKYQDVFEKYKIKSISEAEICNMAEFLITMHPEKYAKSMGTENNYRRDENLRKIYAVVDKQKNMAVLINTNEKGKIPEGEFGVYEFGNKLKADEFKPSDKIEKIVREKVEKFSNGTLTAKEEDEMVKKLMPKTLDDMDKIATIDMEIEEKTKKAIDKKIDEKNAENGKTKEDRETLEKENKEKSEEQVTIGQEKDGQESKKQIPNDVQKACKRLGINHVRSFFYVNATELDNKVDDTRTNKNGNRVLILEVYDNKIDCNKYYGFQDERMVLYGNDSEANKAVKDVTGNVTQMGKLIKPLKPKETQFIEYEDSQGLVIREQIDDKEDLSMQEINQYRKDMEETLTKYSQEMYRIKNDSLLSKEQKNERIQAVDDWCDKKTTEIAKNNDISINADRRIDAITDNHTEDIQENIQEDDEPDPDEIRHKKWVEQQRKK